MSSARRRLSDQLDAIGREALVRVEGASVVAEKRRRASIPTGMRG
jgi:hypothetical protein